MNLKRILAPDFYRKNKEYKEYIIYDYNFNASFRGEKVLPRKFLKSYEWKYICNYRKYQCNSGNIWEHIYLHKLEKLENKTGLSFEGNRNIGKGLIIGHWGRIVINGQTKLGDQLFITHGVTIGRDIRGKRKGVPHFGNRVCVRTNSTIVGNIRIGNDVLIAPNTFVNFDIPDHSVVVGNPAKIHYKENATEGHLPEI